MENKHHKYIVEVLYHFNCSHCKHWWTISDIGENASTLYCPYCGVVNTIREMELE